MRRLPIPRPAAWPGLLPILLLLLVSGCATPPSPGERLVETVNEHREDRGLERVAWSPALAEVAQAHLQDLESSDAAEGEQCNLHSWSDEGEWTACCYRPGDKASAECMRRKPREITGEDYPHAGYEIAAWRSSGMDREEALRIWRDSDAHHEVMVNRGVWSEVEWEAIGAALSEEYALVWFGEEPEGDSGGAE